MTDQARAIEFDEIVTPDGKRTVSERLKESEERAQAAEAREQLTKIVRHVRDALYDPQTVNPFAERVGTDLLRAS